MGGQEEAGVNFKQASGLLTGEGTALTVGGVLSNSVLRPVLPFPEFRILKTFGLSCAH